MLLTLLQSALLSLCPSASPASASSTYTTRQLLLAPSLSGPAWAITPSPSTVDSAKLPTSSQPPVHSREHHSNARGPPHSELWIQEAQPTPTSGGPFCPLQVFCLPAVPLTCQATATHPRALAQSVPPTRDSPCPDRPEVFVKRSPQSSLCYRETMPALLVSLAPQFLWSTSRDLTY